MPRCPPARVDSSLLTARHGIARWPEPHHRRNRPLEHDLPVGCGHKRPRGKKSALAKLGRCRGDCDCPDHSFPRHRRMFEPPLGGFGISGFWVSVILTTRPRHRGRHISCTDAPIPVPLISLGAAIRPQARRVPPRGSRHVDRPAFLVPQQPMPHGTIDPDRDGRPIIGVDPDGDLQRVTKFRDLIEGTEQLFFLLVGLLGMRPPIADQPRTARVEYQRRRGWSRG